MSSSALIPSPFLKNQKFDLFFVLGIPTVGVIVALIAMAYPSYFDLILTLDLALLGYHHVISTYTRLVFDFQSTREHWRLLIPLPIAVIFSVFVIVKIFGIAAVATIYLHWQWYHYTRQSEGVNKAYGFKTKSLQHGHAIFNRFIFYFIPAAAFLAMSARPDTTFLYMQVWKLPVPMWISDGLLIIAGICFAYWFFLQLKSLRDGKLNKLHFAYLLSHYLIYLIAYVLIKDISLGWLAINIWHNAQYIAFVWLFNTNKFKSGIDKEKLTISWLSQPRHWPIYLMVCLIITTIFYGAIDMLSGYFSSFTAVPLVVVFYQTLNFHHYIVDSQIWKLRSKQVQLGLKIS